MANTGQQAQAARDTEQDLDSLKGDLAALRAELVGVMQVVRLLGESAVATAKRQQGVAIDRLTTEAGSLAEEVADAAKDQLADLESRIRAQPLAAIDIAFTVGLLFGSLRR